MVPHVLGVGYAYNEYEVTAGRWKEFEIEFDYADNIKQAAAMLSFKEYICVAICSDVIPQDDLDILRQKRAVPIIVVPPSYSEEQRYACVHFGAAQYLHKLLFFHIIQQYINLFAAIVVAIFIAWKKELVYRDVKQGSNEIKFVKPWVLPPVLYIHNRAWRKVYQLGKIFLCPPFCFPSFFYRYT